MSEDKDSPNQVMTIKEVSRYLRIPVWTVYELTRAGKINGKKFGKHWRFLKSDIVDYFHGMSAANLPQEKRKDPRIKVKMKAEIVPLLSSEGVPVKGTVQDLGVGGVYFTADASIEKTQTKFTAISKQLDTGNPVNIAFEFPKGRIESQGRIVHYSGEGLGIKFRGLRETEKEAIENYVG